MPIPLPEGICRIGLANAERVAFDIAARMPSTNRAPSEVSEFEPVSVSMASTVCARQRSYCWRASAWSDSPSSARARQNSVTARLAYALCSNR
jgi:hypothetical protein